MLSIVESKWMVFVKVTELGSLTHAAAALNQPQSAISRQIGILEQQCGARLFRRTGRGVVLTDFGQRHFPRVKALITQARQLSDDMRASSGEIMGEVRLGVLASMTPSLVDTLLRVSIRRFPHLRLHFIEGSSVQLEDLLNQNLLDLAMLLRDDECDDADEPTLQTLPLMLMGPPDDPVTTQRTVSFDQLAGLPLVLPGGRDLLRARLDALAIQHNVKLAVQVEADSIPLQETIVAAGGGYAVIAAHPRPHGVAARLSAARIVNPDLSRRMVLSAGSVCRHTRATQTVANLLLELRPHVFAQEQGRVYAQHITSSPPVTPAGFDRKTS